jgi:septal ring factor EnvC (AmiA/AmiB activator)
MIRKTPQTPERNAAMAPAAAPTWCVPVLGVALALVLAAAATAADAPAAAPGSPPPETVDALRREADSVEKDIRQRAAEVESFARREGDVLSDLDRADRALQRYRRQAAALEAEMSELDRKTAGASNAAEDLARRIRANRGYLSRRLVALYKIRQMGALNAPAPGDSVVAVLTRQRALERILAHDEQAYAELVAYDAELAELRQLLSRRQEEKRERMAEHERTLSAMTRERANRERLLTRVRSEKDLRLAAIESLKEAARALDWKIQGLTRSPAAPGAGGVPPAPRPFATLKGLLILPVKGKIVHLYGSYRHPRLNVPAFRSGIDIASERGEPVKAVAAGAVVFSDWFKGYGNVVIIDHGEHYYSVYAHLQDAFKPLDAPVRAGEVIATVGDAGALGATGLYFELRHGDRPLDPLEWLQLG